MSISIDPRITWLTRNLVPHRNALADIIGVPRGIVLGWLQGSPVLDPYGEHIDRIISCVTEAAGGRTYRIHPRYLSEKILSSQSSITEVLSSRGFDKSVAMTLLTKAIDMSIARDRANAETSQRLRGNALTAEQREANAEHNRMMHQLDQPE